MVETSFLSELFSTLFLPIFLIVILAGIAGVRPDGIISGYAALLGAVISGVIKLTLGLLSGLARGLPGVVLVVGDLVRNKASKGIQEDSGENSPEAGEAERQHRRKIYVQED